MKSFRQKSLRTRATAPNWSLTLVLERLRQPPFEPLKKAEIKYLTFKTVFLVALATGRRSSEIHAIQRKGLSWPSNKEFIHCRVAPSFVGKNQTALDSKVVQPFKVKSLNQILCSDMDEDLKLCPVRALFEYKKEQKN